MREELLEYYERELNYLRQMGAEFAHKYPQVAGRLLLDPDRCDDPHVGRLLEGFALLAARVHRRIDDDLPEVSESLLRMVHPGYLRPIPSMTVVECQADPAQGKKTAGMKMPKGTQLVAKSSVDDVQCRFMTAYDVDLWPFAVSSAEWRQPERMARPPRPPAFGQPVAAARLRLKCNRDVTFAGLPISTLRFHLAGDANVAFPLYELFSQNCLEVQVRDPADDQRYFTLSPSCVRMIGFTPEESLLPYVRRSMDGHRLLHEYFAFPEKFLFFELDGLEPLTEGFGEEAELVFLFSRFERPERQQALELGVTERSFRLSCTPAINLFPLPARPILLTQVRDEYKVIPDHRFVQWLEIFSIEDVVATNPRLRRAMPMEALHTYRHLTRNRKDMAYWVSHRYHNQLGEREPTTMTISVVDLAGKLVEPDADVLQVKTLCTNFDLPSRVMFGAQSGDFDAVGFAAAKTITAIRRPTASIAPPSGKDNLWRLISLLSLNYLSLNEGGKGALQEMLRLHNLGDQAASENQTGAILRMQSTPSFALAESPYGLAPARGTTVEMDFDEQQFAGAGLYLFAAVLERFLGGYTSVNSFSRLVARSSLRKEVLGKWPPRAGEQTLL